MKGLYLIIVMWMLFAAGCSISNESNTIQNDALSGNEKKQDVNLIHTEKPPTLTITFGEKVLETRQGGYRWSYLDSKTGQLVGIEADSLPPTQSVNVEDAVKVNLSEPITLNFEIAPLNYEIRVWHNGIIYATYNDFEDVKEKGPMVYEILVTWEQGTCSYVVALDFQVKEIPK
nr:hypothetical protein [Lysinibacillus timonensis]